MSSLDRYSTAFFALILVATAALCFPMLFMGPTETAAQDPGGEVFDAQRLVADRFAARAHRMVFIVEAQQGELLTKEPLVELLRTTSALRSDPEIGSKLLSFPERATGREVEGVTTIADAVDAALRSKGGRGLELASEERVRETVSLLLARTGPEAFGLSSKAHRDPTSGRWSSPGLLIYVLADNDALGGGGQVVGLGAGNTAKEEYARNVLSLLRGEQRHLSVWGLAIDANLTAAEQGAEAGPFIGLTILTVLLLLALVFRSYWVVAVTGFALGVLVVWLEGLCNLIGLKADLILDTIVPIAMISFGVDYVFHAVGRYQEESRLGLEPRRALRVSLAGTLSALLLACLSDSAAFLSNTTTGIESLVQFGVAAAIATVVAFVVLGLATPLAYGRIQVALERRSQSRIVTWLGVAGSLLVSLTTMATVVVSVFVSPALGVSLLAVEGLLFLLVPLVLLTRFATKTSRSIKEHRAETRSWAFLGRAVVGAVRLRWILLPLLACMTGYCVYLANQVRAEFDVREFFSSESDFVVGLDKFDRHVGSRGGEPAYIYVEAALENPEVLAALRRFAEDVQQIDTEHLAHDGEGRVLIERGALAILDATLGSPVARSAVESHDRSELEDADADGIPDDPGTIRNLFETARASGVPLDGQRMLRSPEDVRQVLWLAERGEGSATKMTVRLPDSRSQESSAAARAVLESPLADLRQRLQELDSSSRVVMTGAPITRQATLDAILWAFRLSIPVALTLCLLLSALFMRSLRFAVVCIVPILVVVAWLYGFMFLVGLDVNVVTATIGAISIGIGIDFAVHLTMRYREELSRTSSRLEALAVAGSGTGGALTGSALSSVVGFSLLALAPMPMFATYGLLTAVMIVMALAASLLLLPSLLLIVSPRKADS